MKFKFVQLWSLRLIDAGTGTDQTRAIKATVAEIRKLRADLGEFEPPLDVNLYRGVSIAENVLLKKYVAENREDGRRGYTKYFPARSR